MTSKFNWTNDHGVWVARHGDFTLFATPYSLRNGKAARGSKWRAGVSRWDESTKTVNRFGRDVFHEPCDNAAAARKLAEQVYQEAIGP